MISALYQDGKTQKEIAEILGISQSEVSRKMKRQGIKARKPKNLKQFGKNNHQWKGDKAGYTDFHYRVQRWRGKPSICSMCDDEKAKRYEWANITGNYKDITSYIRVCKSCHAKLDGIINNITKGAML